MTAYSLKHRTPKARGQDLALVMILLLAVAWSASWSASRVLAQTSAPKVKAIVGWDSSTMPLPVSGRDDFRKVAAGTSQGLALEGSGPAVAWNRNGQRRYPAAQASAASTTAAAALADLRPSTKRTTVATSSTRRAAAATSNSRDLEWWYRPHKDHTPSGGPTNVKFQSHHLNYLGDTRGKVIYLTFDENIEYGYTSHILDVLKANGVHATFFVTGLYMKAVPDLIKRMVAEGHTVGNHSATHPEHMWRMPDQRIRDEILLAAQHFKDLTGQDMPLLFRPPCGECSERILALTDSLGWRSIFWSIAYVDYLEKEQRGAKYAVDYMMKYFHPGAIILLHPLSSNSEALDAIIKGLKAAGYVFGNVRDIQPGPLIAAAPGSRPVVPSAIKVDYGAIVLFIVILVTIVIVFGVIVRGDSDRRPAAQ